MERLSPPLIDVDDSAALAIRPEIPVEGIARDAFLKQFMRELTRPHPEAGALKLELRSWSGVLGRTEWCRREFSATAALFVRTRSTLVNDSETIGHVVQMCVEFVAPLSRYSAGWGDAMAALRPDGLPVVVVREAQRSVARGIRHDMTHGEPAVQESISQTRTFLAQPKSRHQRDEYLALCAYVTELTKVVAKGKASSRVLTESEKRTVADIIAKVDAEYGAVPREQPSPAEVDELRRQAAEFLKPIVEDYVASSRSHHRPMLGEAYDRVMITYVNRLIAGKPLAGTEYYFRLRVSGVGMDGYRRRAHTRANEGSLVTSDDEGSNRADDRIEDNNTLAENAEHLEILSRAAHYIESDPDHRIAEGALSWEAATACAVMRQTADAVHGEPEHSALKGAIVQAWTRERPSASVCETAGAAATYVLLLMQTAVTRARRDLADWSVS